MISIHLDDSEMLHSIYQRMNPQMAAKWNTKGLSVQPKSEFRPGSLLPAFALGRKRDLHIVPMLWGMTFPPVPGKSSGSYACEIRTDISAEKKTRLWSFHRCLVPMSWYYESEFILNQSTGKFTEGQGRYLCQPKGVDFSFLACIYHLEDGFPAFAVCTCPSLMDTFPNIPVVFGREAIHDWISPDVHPDSLFHSRLLSMITDYEGIQQ